MTTSTIPLEAFEGEYRVKHMGGRIEWRPCQVIGVRDDGSSSRFVILTEDEEDGAMWISDAESVRRV